MKTFKKLWVSLFGLGMIIGIASCGNSSGTVDPLSLFNDSSIPPLDSIIGSGYSFAGGQTFTNATPYWIFSTIGFSGTSYIAPAKGIVTSVGVATFGGNVSGPYITIAHSGRLATRIIGITPVVRKGDSVLSGQIIGTVVAYSGSSIAFQVLLDGSPVCPVSYMSSSFRSQFLGFFGVTALCN